MAASRRQPLPLVAGEGSWVGAKKASKGGPGIRDVAINGKAAKEMLAGEIAKGPPRNPGRPFRCWVSLPEG